MSHEFVLGHDAGVFAVTAPWHFYETSKDGRAVLEAEPLKLEDAIGKSSIGTHQTMAETLYVLRDGMYQRIAHKLLRNASDPKVEYATVSEDYALVQYETMARQLQQLEDKFGIKWYSAGTVGSGAKAFISGHLGGLWNVRHLDGRVDGHLDHVTAQWCHDTSASAAALFPSAFDTVCANTFAAAQAYEHHGFSAKATGDLEARFGVCVESFAAELERMKGRREVFQTLASTPMSQAAAGDFFARLLAENAGTRDRRAAVEATFVATSHAQRQEVVGMLLDASALKASESRAVRESMGVGKGLDLPAKTANLFASRYDRLMELFSNGRASKGVDTYDALGAVTEWVDHDGVAAFRGDSAGHAEKRFTSAISGDGAAIKARAYDLLVETVKVAA